MPFPSLHSITAVTIIITITIISRVSSPKPTIVLSYSSPLYFFHSLSNSILPLEFWEPKMCPCRTDVEEGREEEEREG
jgi:hypothetical protein